MIVKQRETPTELLQCERLIKRLPPTHPAYSEVSYRLAVLKAGLYGEKSVDYHLSNLEIENLLIFQDLRLPLYSRKYFQMDFLLVCPSMIVIIESKHVKGQIQIDPYQMTRELDGKIESFKNPIHQVINQRIHLQALMKKKSYSIPPIFTFVTFTHSNSIITIQKEYPVEQHIVRPEELMLKITSLAKSNTNMFSEHQLATLPTTLIKLHTPKQVNVLEKYNIDPKHVMKGAFCQICNRFSIEKQRSNWTCRICGTIDNVAYRDALLDYYYLFGRGITTRACMDLFGITSRHIAYRILCETTHRERLNSPIYELNLEILRPTNSRPLRPGI